MSNDFEPKIYVACLAAHNAGISHSCWIAVNDDVNKLRQAVKNMLAKSPVSKAEEWIIQGYEGFGKLTISESEDFSSVCQKAEFARKYGELGTKLAAYYGEDLKYAKDALKDCYYGEWDSELDFTKQLIDDIYNIPNELQYYFDYKAFCHDLFIYDHFSIKINGRVHVFSEH